MRCSSISLSFFFNDTATTEIYTLSLHDALPISKYRSGCRGDDRRSHDRLRDIHLREKRTVHFHDACRVAGASDRKSTRLNSSHLVISYAVFCLKKKKNTKTS